MSNVKYKNYLDHEIKVRFADGIIEHSQNWQWFIDYIEENYNLSDVDSFSDFNDRSTSLNKILMKFLRILEVCNKEFHFETLLLSEIYLISKYYVGAVGRKYCSLNIKTNCCRLLFLIVWLTKLENSGNNSKYIIDQRFIKQRNFHQAISMEAFDYDKENILSYLNQISVIGFEQVKQNIEDNLNRVVYGVSDNFLDKYRDNLLSANCFGFQNLDRNSTLTWEENTLLDMLQISVREGKIVPMFSQGDVISPDYFSWTPLLLKQIKNYFNHEISDFVIESIDFLVNRNSPSLLTIETHCELFVELLRNSNIHEISFSSTYQILALLFKEKSMNKKKSKKIEAFYKSLGSITSINLLLVLQKYFPMTSNQSYMIRDYIQSQYKKILQVEDINDLTNYIKNLNIARYIDQKYYVKVKDKFFWLVKETSDMRIVNLFYQAMLFLLEIKNTNQIIDKRMVKQDMIYLQQYWEKNVYQRQMENLQEFKYSTSISTEEVEKLNKSIMNNPIIAAHNCIISKVEDMVPFMEKVSKQIFRLLASRTIISPIFPMEDKGIDFDKHDIDQLLKIQVDNIIQTSGYKFLNRLEAELYVSAMHERYRDCADFIMAIFNKEKELYDLLDDFLEEELILYEKNILLGHLTQLFPILEIEIRDLGKMFGIVPFKETVNHFMKFKDPSSILRELIGSIYDEWQSLENIPDLLFIYHFMYNSNSLNIRNECIHGRDYIEGSRLRFGFKVTVLSLYMLKYRKNLILTNMAKLSE